MIARVLPGLAAGALALIYLVGSLNAAGAFARDDITVTAVRLLSIEQILVRGVSVVTQPGTLVVLVVVSLSLYLTIGSADLADPPSRSRKGTLFLLAGATLFSLGTACFISWRIGVIAAIYPLAYFFELLLPAPESSAALKNRAIRLTIGTGACVFLACAYFGAFVQPLAKYTSAGRAEEGVMVTHTNGTWYVSSEGNDQLVALSDEAIGAVNLIYRDTPWRETLVSVIDDTLN